MNKLNSYVMAYFLFGLSWFFLFGCKSDSLKSILGGGAQPETGEEAAEAEATAEETGNEQQQTAAQHTLKPVQLLSEGSVELELYSFEIPGATKNILIVGGMHGAYEWDTVRLSYELIKYFDSHKNELPKAANVHIFPNANPKSFHKEIETEESEVVTFLPYIMSLESISDFKNPKNNPGFVIPEGRKLPNTLNERVHGRTNENNVDLNRNWGLPGDNGNGAPYKPGECDVQSWDPEPQGFLSGLTLDGGSAPFSEPENKILKKFIEETLDPKTITAAFFYHSNGNFISPGSCGTTVDENNVSQTLAMVYASSQNNSYRLTDASEFDYTIKGDASDYLNNYLGIPAITIELQSGNGTDQDLLREKTRNIEGLKGIFNDTGYGGGLNTAVSSTSTTATSEGGGDQQTTPSPPTSSTPPSSEVVDIPGLIPYPDPASCGSSFSADGYAPADTSRYPDAINAGMCNNLVRRGYCDDNGGNSYDGKVYVCVGSLSAPRWFCASACSDGDCACSDGECEYTNSVCPKGTNPWRRFVP